MSTVRYSGLAMMRAMVFRASLMVLGALPWVALAQERPPSESGALVTARPVAGVDAGASAFDDAGRPLQVQRIVLQTRATSEGLAQPEIEEYRSPGPGRSPLRLESSAPGAEFFVTPSEDDIPRELRRPGRSERRSVCHGDCLLYVPTSRPLRVTTHAAGTDISADVNAPPEGVRLRFHPPSQRALVAAYVLYPTAAALGLAGTIAALLVQDPGVRLGSAIGLFSGAAVTLGIGIAANVVAFDGTVRSQPLTNAPSATR
jgi:hypothetical protein